MCRRTASFNNIIAIAGRDMFCGVNSSYKDICSIANLTTDVEDYCNGHNTFDGTVCVSAGPITTASRLSSTVKETTMKTTKTSTTKTTSTTKSTTTTTSGVARQT